MKSKIFLLAALIAAVFGVANCSVSAGPSCSKVDNLIATHTECIDYSKASLDATAKTTKENACKQSDLSWKAGTWNAAAACDATKYAHSCETLDLNPTKTYYNNSDSTSGVATDAADRIACGLGTWK